MREARAGKLREEVLERLAVEVTPARVHFLAVEILEHMEHMEHMIIFPFLWTLSAWLKLQTISYHLDAMKPSGEHDMWSQIEALEP